MSNQPMSSNRPATDASQHPSLTPTATVDNSGATNGKSSASLSGDFERLRGVSQARSIHHSYWIRNRARIQRFPQVDADVHTDVLVMGAGITGLSIALRLLEDGLRVAVCEANLVGLGTTTGSTGHLDAHPEYEAASWLKRLGAERAKQLTTLRMRAIDLIESRCDEACQFARIPAYYYTEDPSHADSVSKEADAAASCGLDVSLTYQVPLPLAYCGYRVEQMARFDCAAYHDRLLQLVVAAGGQVFEQSLVSGPSGASDTVLEVGKGRVHYDQLVCATHANNLSSLRLDAQLIPTQSYVLAARLRQPIRDALYWDDCMPYHYIRQIANDGHEVLIGGKDHRTGAGDPVAAQTALEQWAGERFEIEHIIARWSAEFFDPVDELPFIGRAPDAENIWIATGLSGIGLTLGTVAGELIGDLMCGKQVAIADSVSPVRFKLSTAASAIKDQLPAAADYMERVLPAAAVVPNDLRAGQGQTGLYNGRHVALCRDRQGCLHELSPICTHMGGVVHWNEVEQTWDCPVHGGRFTADGQRLYGPPTSDLDPAES